MKKLFPILLLSTVLISAKCSTEKYSAPTIKDVMVLSTWNEEKQVDVATCMVIDDLITKDNFDERVINHVAKYMNQHPQLSIVLQSLKDHKAEIIKSKEYEITIAYCRGNTTIFPEDKLELTKWAEGNRMGRIKCEYGNNP